MTMRRFKITSGGQISIPAAVRHRWETGTVTIDDRGDHLIVKPAPDDLIEATYGIFKDYPGPPAEEAMRQLREEERIAEERKWGADA